MRVNVAPAQIVIKLPESMSNGSYIGFLAKLAGSAGGFTVEEKTVTFESSTDQGNTWTAIGNVIMNADQAASTDLWEVTMSQVNQVATTPIWIRLYTGGVKFHVLDNIHILSDKGVSTSIDSGMELDKETVQVSTQGHSSFAVLFPSSLQNRDYRVMVYSYANKCVAQR